MQIRDRVKRLERIRAKDLLPNPKNWRLHPQYQQDALREVLAEIGYADALLAREVSPGKFMLIDGHLRAETTPDEIVPVLVLDITDAEADKLLAVLDPLAAGADVDGEKLKALLGDIGATSDAIDSILSDFVPEAKAPKKAADEFHPEYAVLIKCQGESDQKAILTELDRHQLDARAIIVDMPPVERIEELPEINLGTGEVKITRQTKIVRSPRVMQLEGIFDVPPSKSAKQTWKFGFKLDRPWNIGLIVGPSGSGKTTVARELFGDKIVSGWPWSADKAIIDDFPERLGVAEITAILSSVGFSSPPAWMKPFHVLSNGEQFRVNLARTLAEGPELAVIDEFTSVVDRTVAQIGSSALAKTIRAGNRRLIAVACHYDIEEWLQPDWKLEMPNGEFTWRSLRRRPEIQLSVRRVSSREWAKFRAHHYLNHDLNPAAQCFVASVDGRPAAFTAVLHNPHAKGGFWREHRTVCLPDFQGVGIGNAMSELIAGAFSTTKPYRSTTSHPAMIRHRLHSANWRCTRAPSLAPAKASTGHAMNRKRAAYRFTAGFHYVGPLRWAEAEILGL